VRHVVRRGETLGTIARQYGVTWSDIASANGIVNADRVLVGQELIIPGVSAAADAGLIENAAYAPSPTITDGRQIIVDLSDSRIYAYEDGALVYDAIVSTGLPATPTVQGDFKVYHRLRSQTMSGPGYYLPNVEYVQYFYQGYAIHGTYWHNNFGQPMSHGCVNLTNADAAWFYEFGEIGTPVRVQL
jgi:lipoprotein-anchoring transpeptidase ErfK/SrfK